MTKLRPPVSYERALIRIADHVGWDAMAAEIGRSVRTVMDYSDQDVDTGITLAHASKLEKLYRRQGGEGYPISDCMRLRVRLAENLEEDGAAIDKVLAYFREHGEANPAVIAATAPGATRIDRAIACRELAEAIGASTDLLRLLTDEPAAPAEPP